MMLAEGMIGRIIAKIAALIIVIAGAIILSLYSARLEQRNKELELEMEETLELVERKEVIEENDNSPQIGVK